MKIVLVNIIEYKIFTCATQVLLREFKNVYMVKLEIWNDNYVKTIKIIPRVLLVKMR